MDATLAKINSFCVPLIKNISVEGSNHVISNKDIVEEYYEKFGLSAGTDVQQNTTITSLFKSVQIQSVCISFLKTNKLSEIDAYLEKK